MSRDVSQDVKDELKNNRVTFAILLETSFDSGTNRTWTGHDDLVIDIDDDNTDETFHPVGEFMQVDSIAEADEIRAEGIQVTLQAVPTDHTDRLDDALDEAFQGDPAKMWLAFINIEDESVIGDPLLMFDGRMDTMTIQENPESLTATLTIESVLRDLKKPRNRRYTPQDQKERFPNDKGLDFIPQMKNKQLQWGSIEPKEQEEDDGFLGIF